MHLKLSFIDVWIIFAVLLVVFIPAFSVIFSPSYIPSECTECTPCPECPPCPEAPELPPIAGQITIFGHYIPEEFMTMFEFYLELNKYEHYKYIIVVPFPRSVVLWGEIFNFDNLDEYWYLEPRQLNDQKTYFEIKESVRNDFWYYVSDTSPSAWHAGRYIVIYLIREDLDPVSVLT